MAALGTLFTAEPQLCSVIALFPGCALLFRELLCFCYFVALFPVYVPLVQPPTVLQCLTLLSECSGSFSFLSFGLFNSLSWCLPDTLVFTGLCLMLTCCSGIFLHHHCFCLSPGLETLFSKSHFPLSWFTPLFYWSTFTTSFLRKSAWEICEVFLDFAYLKMSLFHCNIWLILWMAVELQIKNEFSLELLTLPLISLKPF